MESLYQHWKKPDIRVDFIETDIVIMFRFLSLLIFFLIFSDLPLSADTVENEERHAYDTGLILFDQARRRYWSAEGTHIGSLGLLKRAIQSLEHIADPVVRYYLLAEIELYRGRMMLEIESRSEARPYFLEAMKLANMSASHQETAEANRVRAEAGYAWLYSRRIWRRPSISETISRWSNKAMYLDPENLAAQIIQIKVELRKTRKGSAVLNDFRQRLEALESNKELDAILLFRTRLLLAEVYRKLHDKDNSRKWCSQAALIFPKNPVVKRCH